MKKFFLFFLWMTCVYTTVAGLAWAWVLDLSYPFWKLFVISLFNAVLSIIQIGLFGSKK